jgi:hypothetical protein
MKLADLPVPSTPVAQTARAVVAEFSPPALVNHCERSYLFSSALAQSVGIDVDHELLYVATMLHDLALEEAFDNATVPFEIAGGQLASLFCAGAAWPADRRARAADIIVDHMRGDTDPAVDPEGYLLARATSLDISGYDPAAWPAPLLAEIVAAHPRLDLGDLFIERFAGQAARKPACSAAASVRSGIATRIRTNPLENLASE